MPPNAIVTDGLLRRIWQLRRVMQHGEEPPDEGSDILDTRTHDIIAVATGTLLVPAAYALLESGSRDDTAVGAAVLTGAHLIFGLLFSAIQNVR